MRPALVSGCVAAAGQPPPVLRYSPPGWMLRASATGVPISSETVTARAMTVLRGVRSIGEGSRPPAITVKGGASAQLALLARSFLTREQLAQHGQGTSVLVPPRSHLCFAQCRRATR